VENYVAFKSVHYHIILMLINRFTITKIFAVTPVKTLHKQMPWL